MEDVVERDGVRYSVMQDMLTGDFTVMARRPKSYSYEADYAPTPTWEDPYGEVVIGRRETVEHPEIRLNVRFPGGEVRKWRAHNGGRSLPEAEAALYMGIEHLEPRVQELLDPKLRAQREQEREADKIEQEKKRIAAEAAAKRQAEAARLKAEREAREQDALEALPEYGLF